MSVVGIGVSPLGAVIGGLGGAAPWHPSDLFQSGELGGAWDATDLSTLYTDAGTTLTTADDDLIYQVNDISGNGNHVRQATEGSRPLRKTNGVAHLLADGTDDWMGGITTVTVSPPWTILTGIRPLETTGTTNKSLIGLGKDATNYVTLSRRGDVQRSVIEYRGAEFGSAYVGVNGTASDFPVADATLEMHLTQNDVDHIRNGSTLASLTVDFLESDEMTSTIIYFGSNILSARANARYYRQIAISRLLTGDDLTAARAWIAAGYSGAT